MLLSALKHVTNSVSSREVFNEKIKIFSSIKNTSHFLYNKEIEKNLKINQQYPALHRPNKLPKKRKRAGRVFKEGKIGVLTWKRK